MASKLEFERKFLLLKKPVLKADKVANIEQHYTKEGRVRRVTIKGKPDAYYHTVKKRIRSGVNSEDETKITLEVYYEFLEKVNYSIFKERHYYKTPSGMWEVDIFNDCNLIIAEIEVKTENELENIKIPKFIKDVTITEVTDIQEFSSKNIAKKIS